MLATPKCTRSGIITLTALAAVTDHFRPFPSSRTEQGPPNPDCELPHLRALAYSGDLARANVQLLPAASRSQGPALPLAPGGAPHPRPLCSDSLTVLTAPSAVGGLNGEHGTQEQPGLPSRPPSALPQPRGSFGLTSDLRCLLLAPTLLCLVHGPLSCPSGSCMSQEAPPLGRLLCPWQGPLTLSSAPVISGVTAGPAPQLLPMCALLLCPLNRSLSSNPLSLFSHL